ncbi:MAG TPA: N-acetylmuramoyl-L-alanine amidase, partial [Candidatus Eisenbacteria bacterium]|nr:N-acetylmuramoyl-L-alanine amidase [Candidatus Eisenbacteria bacterium]
MALLAALAGCAGPHPRPPVPPAAPPAPVVVMPKPGYDSLLDRPDSVDASGLSGRRIAIDPGHGGFFTGAVGVHGLTEKEVNLDVALRLRDLLTAHGAHVLLTRETDRDFLTPADSSLHADLAARTAIANAFHPDLFMSIHHNADAGAAHDVNETQTYYQLGDEGVALDAAQDVHRSLVRNVAIGSGRVIPGNYFVLRTSDSPGLLTETSYITYPPTEQRLATPGAQEIEAEALYVGLARYFARRVPVIETFTARDPDTGEDTLFARGEPRIAARVRGGFDDVALTVDGAPAEVARRDSSLTWVPAAPLDDGPHEARIEVRL